MVISLVIGFSRYRSSGARLITTFRRDGIFYFVTMAGVYLFVLYSRTANPWVRGVDSIFFCVGVAIGNIIFDSVAPLEYKFMLMAYVPNPRSHLPSNLANVL
jgi:hypothetical protein